MMTNSLRPVALAYAWMWVVVLGAVVAARRGAQIPLDQQEVDSALLQVYVLHRHGARQEPELLANGDLSWRKAQLTEQGELMALSLGTALRERYGTWLSQCAATNPASFVEATSTDYSRTIQTGFGVLSALLSNTTAATPFLRHTPLPKDYTVGFPGNFPNHVLTNEVYWGTVYHWDAFAAGILQASGIETLVQNFGSWCASSVMNCALYAEDVYQCRRSNRPQLLTPSLAALYPKLHQIQSANNAFTLGRNTSSPFFAAGSPAYRLTMDWLDGAEAALASNRTGPGSTGLPCWNHFSAHDTTLTGMYVALGSLSLPDVDQSDSPLWVPQFAETLIAEVYANSTVSFLRGLPNESYGSGYAFSFAPLRVGCGIAANNTMSFPSQCSLEMLREYVAANTAPTAAPITSGSVTAECWLPDAFVGLCDTADQVPSDACVAYRLACHQACAYSTAPNSVLDETTGICLSFVPDTFRDHAAPAIGAAAGALVGGLFIGRLIRWLVDYEDRVHPDDDEYMHVEGEDPVSDDDSVSDDGEVNGEASGRICVA